MTNVRMTQYPIERLNTIVFPECPYALQDGDYYDSKEVICGIRKGVIAYCSALNETGNCPFDAKNGR